MFLSYVKACVNEGFVQVTRLDRNAILKAITSGEDLVAPVGSAPSSMPVDVKMDLESEVLDGGSLRTLRDVMTQERFFHDRQTVLINPKKNFQILLKSLQSYEQNKKRSSAVSSHAPGAQRIVERENQRFSRDQLRPDEFWKDRMGGLSDVKIEDTGGSLATFLSGGSSTPSKSSMSSTPVESRRANEGHKRSINSSNSSKRAKTESSKPKGNPIILIPSTSTSPINRNNAYEFFQNGNYEANPTQVKSNRKTVIERVLKDGNVEKYEIVDNVIMLEDRDWDRVVATFVIGKEWELKNYKHTTVAEIFHKIRGYFINFDDSKVPEIIKKWNVKVLSLSSHKRHYDQSTLSEFWSDLDSFKARKGL